MVQRRIIARLTHTISWWYDSASNVLKPLELKNVALGAMTLSRNDGTTDDYRLFDCAETAKTDVDSFL